MQFEEMAESAARAAAKALLDGAREDIVAEAVRKSGEASGRTEVDALSKDVSSLRAAVAKLAEARPAQAAAAPRPRAQEPTRRPRQNEDGAAAQGAAAGQNERNPQTQEQMAKARD